MMTSPLPGVPDVTRHCCPGGHSVFWQQDASVMQVPLHSFWPNGQAHAAAPPSTERQASPPVHSVLPQHAVAGMHAPLHSRWPLGHVHAGPVPHTWSARHEVPACAPVQSRLAPQNCRLWVGSMQASTPVSGAVQATRMPWQVMPQ